MPSPLADSLPLLAPSAPRLVGIARLAALGESIAEGHEVEYFTLPVKSLLNRCTSPRMPFTWTINPYRGCEFACKYCYARYTHEFMEMRDGVDFERRIFVKQQAAWLLRQDLKKVKRGEEIALGTATDPYQPAERRYGITPRSWRNWRGTPGSSSASSPSQTSSCATLACCGRSRRETSST